MGDRCCMCLIAERRLIEVSARHLQHMLLIYLDLKVVTWVCWECEARLSRLSAFRLQVAEAQRVLQQLLEGHSPLPLKSLSKLSHHHKSTFDASIIENDDGTQNQIFFVNDVSMKQENDEIEMKIETDYNNEPFDDHGNEFNKQEFNIDDNLKHESDNENDNLKHESDNENDNLKHESDNDDDNVDNDNSFNENDNIITIDNSYTSVKLSKTEMEEQREKKRNENKFSIAPYKCETCIIKYFSKDELKTHHKKFHNRENGYECKICEQRFENKILQKSHMRFHYYINQCNLCQYKTTNLYYIRMHFKTKHLGTYKCTQCNEVCETFPALRRHMDDSHKENIKCEVCGKEVKHRRYKTHMDIHKKAKSKCSICNKRFKCLENHMKTHVPVIEKEKVKVSNMLIPEENRYCIECDLKFTTKYGLNNHLRHSKKHAVCEPKFECDYCGKKWQYKHKLRAHIAQAHLKQGRLVCRYTECRQVVSRREEMRAHLATCHANDPPPRDKICPHCGKGFYVKRILDNHIVTHTGERPHRCPQCDKGFTQKQCVTAHLLKAHGIAKKVEGVISAVNKRFPCPECDMAYVKKQRLRWHLYKKHGYNQYDYSI